MRLVTIDKSLLEKYRQDPQVLHKDKRPYVLVIQLRYHGQKQDFAVPDPFQQSGSKKYLRRYRTEGNDFAILIQNIIDRNAKQIITACQNYLTAYEAGEQTKFSTDIDLLLTKLNMDS